ncbi:MAG: hypothetical protein V1875_03015 [Candidatus Altiarchaeota archaeon]
MISLGELKAKYDEMDPVSRQNLWFAVAGAILAIILFINLSNSADTIGKFFRPNPKP